MTNKTTKRIGPSMQRAIDYVAAHPGCSMYDAAVAAHPHATKLERMRNNALGYTPVHRAIKAGKLIKSAGARRGWYTLTVAA